MVDKLILRAARGEKVDRTPLWMMRQAGRYLPEYHEIKRRAGGFLGLCKTPELCVEATLQPVRRFGFDAAILFSDILIPAEAMGIELDFDPGPVISNPLGSARDVDALRIPAPEESLGFVLEAIRGLREELDESTALIGFAGAPYTVASYIVDDGDGRAQEGIRRMIYEAPSILEGLMDKLVETTIAYLGAQIEAGAEAIQLFDSSAGLLPPPLFEKLALAPARRVLEGVGGAGVPRIYFAPGAMTNLDEMAASGADVVGVDFRVGLDDARARLGEERPVQGNLDPAVLLGPPSAVRREVGQVLAENAGRPGHIFNLGHGVLPSTPIASVEALVSAVHEGK